MGSKTYYECEICGTEYTDEGLRDHCKSKCFFMSDITEAAKMNTDYKCLYTVKEFEKFLEKIVDDTDDLEYQIIRVKSAAGRYIELVESPLPEDAGYPDVIFWSKFSMLLRYYSSNVGSNATQKLIVLHYADLTTIMNAFHTAFLQMAKMQEKLQDVKKTGQLTES
jgi:hypothetical protein